MPFVDTSVWIDFLADKETPQVDSLSEAIESGETLYYTGLVLQELLQGIQSSRLREQVERSFAPMIEIFPDRSTYRLAADLYRKSRKNGHPIRSSIDCLIAGCCIEHGLELLHRDRDFKYIAEVSKLKLRP